MKMKHTCVRENRIGLLCHESQVRDGEYYSPIFNRKYIYQRVGDGYTVDYSYVTGNEELKSNPTKLWNTPEPKWIRDNVVIIEGPEG